MVALLAVVYFAFYTLYGHRGYYTYKSLQADLASKEGELTSIRTEREQLEHYVRLMRPESLDPDMLSEQIRKNLYYVHPNDIVIKLQ